MGAAARPLHALNRVAFGPRPGDAARVRQIGVERYLEQQLDAASIAEPPALSERIAGLRTLHMTPVDLFREFQEPIRAAAKGDVAAQQAARRQARQVIDEAAEARIVRALYGPRQLQEVMTAFWFNHFNIFAGKGLCSIWTGAFEEEAIRPHTLGRFRDLLGATAMHPAMLFYLDNWQNTAPGAPGTHGKFDGINENYARELMELHTLGVNGGYTQTDVIALAHILTGWGLVKGGAGNGQPPHGGMGLREGSGDAALPGNPWWRRSTQAGGGIAQGERALDILARSPATANHLSYQLAQYFVADNPSNKLVSRLAARYQASDGNLRDVLATLFSSPEFWDPHCYGVKFKTPYEYAISAARAVGAEVINVRPLTGTMAQMGMPLYGCPTPDGYKNTAAAWLNPEAMMMRLSFATALGAGRLPLERGPGDNPAPMAGVKHPERVRQVEFNGASAAPDAAQLALTLADAFSPRTADAVEAAPIQLRTPLILGSPEFMMR